MNNNKDEVIKQLKIKDSKYKALKKEFHKTLSEEVDLFKKYIEKYGFIIDFLQKNNISFIHPKYNYHIEAGPIIGYEDYKLYIYDYDKKQIKEINVNDKSDRRIISPYEFFQGHDFETAIEGIKYVSKIQDFGIDTFSEAIENEKQALKKYELE